LFYLAAVNRSLGSSSAVGPGRRSAEKREKYIDDDLDLEGKEVDLTM